MATLLHTDGSQTEVFPTNGSDFNLKECQAVVGGYIEIINLSDGRIMVIHEEGKLEDLPLNYEATKLFLDDRDGYDEIVGDALVCASHELA